MMPLWIGYFLFSESCGSQATPVHKLLVGKINIWIGEVTGGASYSLHSRNQKKSKTELQFFIDDLGTRWVSTDSKEMVLPLPPSLSKWLTENRSNGIPMMWAPLSVKPKRIGYKTFIEEYNWQWPFLPWKSLKYRSAGRRNVRRLRSDRLETF